MKLVIEWERPIGLQDAARQRLIYTINFEKVRDNAGIYVFGRRWGKSIEALYVGKATNIQQRVKGHFNNLMLMQHLKYAKTGKRVLIHGRVITKPGQRLDKVLALLERGLIRHFLSEGHDLVNKQGVRIRRHEIESGGHIPRKFIPALMYLERPKGG